MLSHNTPDNEKATTLPTARPVENNSHMYVNSTVMSDRGIACGKQ